MSEEVLVERLPMYVNLGDIGNWGSQIGWAKIVRDTETGRNKIEIDLDEASSKQLGDMTDAFRLKAVGFAGIKIVEKAEVRHQKETGWRCDLCKSGGRVGHNLHASQEKIYELIEENHREQSPRCADRHNTIYIRKYGVMSKATQHGQT